jgi:glycosyltransferase involved in cell wall biosynthesis
MVYKRKRIAITPVYNEEATIVEVLDQIHRYVDLLIIVDDGSIDSSKAKIETWKKSKEGVYFISLMKNIGASGALKKGYFVVINLVDKGAISENDLVVEIDSDGQHDPRYIKELCDYFEEKSDQVEVVLARRDFANYPWYKILGNRFLTLIASLLSLTWYKDVESNFRVMEAKCFEALLGFFGGYRYSGAFEVGIILGLQGKKVDNSYLIHIPRYRPGSRIRDGFHVLIMGIWAWIKVLFKLKTPNLVEQSKEVMKDLVV